jgi:hypothetical protein
MFCPALLFEEEEAQMRLRKSMKQAGMVLIAVLLLASTPALAAERPSSGGVLDWAWGWVRSIWENNGMAIDPNGLTVSSPDDTPGETPNNSMHIDPNG